MLRRLKVILGGLGLAVGVAGMALRRDAAVMAAAALLAASVVVRLIERKRAPSPD